MLRRRYKASVIRFLAPSMQLELFLQRTRPSPHFIEHILPILQQPHRARPDSPGATGIQQMVEVVRYQPQVAERNRIFSLLSATLLLDVSSMRPSGLVPTVSLTESLMRFLVTAAILQ